MAWISIFITLCLVIDPFGSIPLVVHLVPESKSNLKRYIKIIFREGLIALAALLCFYFAGNSLLEMLGISKAALSIAGAIVLFMISIRMIFPRPSGDMLTGGRKTGEALVVPIAIPLIAGPSSMTMVMLLAAKYPENQFMMFGAICASWLVAVITFMSAPLIMKLLGSKVTEAIERLMGMLLVTVAAEMMLNGIKMAIQNHF